MSEKSKTFKLTNIEDETTYLHGNQQSKYANQPFISRHDWLAVTLHTFDFPVPLIFIVVDW